MPRAVALAALALGLLVPAAAPAQSRERIKITGVRLGLPRGPFGGDNSRTGMFKPGQWAPVYIDLECAKDIDPEVDTRLQIVVETTDADDVITQGVVEVPAMKQGQRLGGNEMGRLPYLKPGNSYTCTVKVQVKGATSGRTYSSDSEVHFTPSDPATFLVCGLGHTLPGLRLTEEGNRANNPNAEPIGRELRNGWIETAQITDVGLMPDQWIGYSAVDLVVVGTGANVEFWNALAQPQHARKRKALAEWVRRGGRLVLSIGTNADVLEPLKEISDILPAAVRPAAKKTVTTLGYQWGVHGYTLVNGQLGFRDGRSQFSYVPLEPKAGPNRVVLDVVDEADGRTRRLEPLGVQGPHGEGRVTVLGFDLDRAPFTESPARTNFWESLITIAGFRLPGPSDRFNQSGNQYDQYAGELQGSLDFFEGVPVVSFGWVALFILIYIVLIGPVDYLFLKKVVKRLEWTWVTFPVIVIVVSAGAYFAAYALKGKDLKINKVDVVDIDLAGGRVDGNCWFTLFSPRIQNYTIAVEPAGPVWTPANPTVAAHDTVLSWQASVDRSRYGGGTGGGFLSERYRFQSIADPADPNRDLYASGLEDVPIRVWTTKGFRAQWSAPIDPAKPPISAELSVSRARDSVLVGTITSNLPVERFSDAALFWRGQAYDLAGDLPPGVPKAISLSVEQGGNPAGVVGPVHEWLQSGQRRHVPRAQYKSSAEPGTTENPVFPLWAVLFNDLAQGETAKVTAPNASLRKLDQSWRVASDRPEQAILVLRVATHEGPAEEMTKAGDMPSRLWLGALPTAGGNRPAIQGTLKQETYVRVLIPVKQPAPEKKQ